MTLEKQRATRALAEELIEEHLNSDYARELRLNNHRLWSFAWSNAKSTYGFCSYGKYKIIISRVLNAGMSMDHIEQTILHEIAHAIDGPKPPSHGRSWVAMARRIGVRDPKATKVYDGDPDLKPKRQWFCVFGSKIVSSYYRRPSRRRMENVDQLFCRGRKAETLGKLRYVTRQQYIDDTGVTPTC